MTKTFHKLTKEYNERNNMKITDGTQPINIELMFLVLIGINVFNSILLTGILLYAK